MHYFIDGYNLIRSLDWMAGGSLRDQRERLLRYIEEKHPQGAGRHRVTVVFDGQADVTSPPWTGPTQVLFSSGQDADHVLKDRVDHLPNPREAVVVTNDRGIQRWVRGVGARVMSCEEFAGAGAARTRRRRAEALDPESARQINDEFRDIWKLK